MSWQSHWLRLNAFLRLLANFEFGAATMMTPSPSIHSTIPPVFNGIVASATQSSSDFGPSLAHLRNHLLNQKTFLGSDGIMIEIRLQVLVEALPTLFRRSGLNGLRDAHPVVCAVKLNQ